jgi:hypothetical protein
MPGRRALLLALVVFAVLAAAGAVYYRHRVDQAAADCAMPAPPDKPATPPPNLPGFQTEPACGPGESPGSATPAAGVKKQK